MLSFNRFKDVVPMLIEKRDTSLKYPKAIKEEKTRLVLDWLLEFRFSSIDLLAKRIGSNE